MEHMNTNLRKTQKHTSKIISKDNLLSTMILSSTCKPIRVIYIPNATLPFTYPSTKVNKLNSFGELLLLPKAGV